ncbi:hypothetical protein ZHAS_00004416 [Anopheles sinensis]|uniref:Uncharacterized protein n=1 Tax=Anopheles sinensis TaxID=74873 RepID=A0A084VGW1_ANOSI|nr:hypothetical protein ZHAS_00004416 [Anopheles sinensis]
MLSGGFIDRRKGTNALWLHMLEPRNGGGFLCAFARTQEPLLSRKQRGLQAVLESAGEQALGIWLRLPAHRTG